MKKILTLLFGLSLLSFNQSYAADEPAPGLSGEYFDLGVAVEDFPTIPADKKRSEERRVGKECRL